MEKTIANVEARLKRCEEDIKELKGYKDECSENNNKTKNDLIRTIQKIEDLIETVEKLPESIEKSMLKSIELQAKEYDKRYGIIEERIIELQKDNEQSKKDIGNLKQLLDKRTVEEDSGNYKKIKFFVITTILGSVLGFILGLFFKYK